MKLLSTTSELWFTAKVARKKNPLTKQTIVTTSQLSSPILSCIYRVPCVLFLSKVGPMLLTNVESMVKRGRLLRRVRKKKSWSSSVRGAWTRMVVSPFFCCLLQWPNDWNSDPYRRCYLRHSGGWAVKLNPPDWPCLRVTIVVSICL